MPNVQQDTEITLGTGRMLALFFALVAICAGFFAIGFSLGRKATMVGSGNVLTAQAGSPSSVVRPSAGKNNAPQPTPNSGDFSFYKAVEQKTADTNLTTPAAQAPPATANSSDPPKTDENPAAPNPAASSYYVQVAAVTRQEDADALVEALKKKQYPAFSANNPSVDKFFRVQVGPYADIKDAEIMRGRLIADGYNPILKK
jgi:cell division septation protein DedD